MGRKKGALRRPFFVVAGIALAVCALQAQSQPSLGKVWAETPLGDPAKSAETGRGLRPMPESAFKFEGGIYRSVVSRISLTLPRIGNEQVVSVREAVVYRRADGQTATSHVLFVPDRVGTSLNPSDGVSAVVVTRLRDDRPKDRESILRSWEPQTEQQRQGMEAAGAFHRRVQTGFGEAVERLILNRTATEPFPYKTNLDRGPAVKTVGVSRFVVIGTDSFVEFSQVFPCGQLAAEACRTAAIESSDRFLAGVREFLIFPPAAN